MFVVMVYDAACSNGLAFSCRARRHTFLKNDELARAAVNCNAVLAERKCFVIWAALRGFIFESSLRHCGN